MKPLLVLLVCLGAGLPVAAHECEGGLRADISLPRELRVTPELATKLLATPEHAEVLWSLSRIFAALNEVNLDTVARGLSAETSQTDTILAARQGLRASPLAEKLTRADIDRLAVMLKGAVRVPKTDLAKFGNLDRRAFDHQLQWSTQILRSASARAAILDLLDLPDAQVIYQKLMRLSIQGVARHKIQHSREISDIEHFRRELIKGRVSNENGLVLRSFLISAAIAAFDEVFNHPDEFFIEHTSETSTSARGPFLKTFAEYLAGGLQAKNQLETLVSILDFSQFGTPLPVAPVVLQSMAIEQAKNLLLPLKNSAKISQTAVPPRPVAAVAPLELRFVDHYAPKNIPSIRERSKSVAPAADDQKPEDSIDPSRALRAFTTFSRQKRHLDELREDLDYQVWFLREDHPTLQTVRFSREVLDWFRHCPVAAQQMINALHLGHARMPCQAGIKYFGRYSAHYDGPVFELKISMAYRGLMIADHNHWQLVTVSDKNNFARVATEFRP